MDNLDDALHEATELCAFVTHSRNPMVQKAFERLNALLDTFKDSSQFKCYLTFAARAAVQLPQRHADLRPAPERHVRFHHARFPP
ncbi:hypothetical protein [Alicyclobacillus mali (ex Roth et al. 2021)]|uniref:hypothetical protein n=1 Tax=Alicyclobacillus mali (ex Roth et al. 2021) TaxID=1123961 RepID=UPI001A8C5A15|nr:hypothetical protein [Alicyclobacillus mali (ex Roth et al. 2021)]